jgi:trehalose 6-phosphate phosphatase
MNYMQEVNTSPIANSRASGHHFTGTPSWCLFVGIDGVLLDIAPTPEEVSVDSEVIDLLHRLDRVCEGALALVTGRTIAGVDQLFAPLQLPVTGVHGLQRRDARGRTHGAPVHALDAGRQMRQEMGWIATSARGLCLEDKGMGFALHYRNAPHLEEVIRVRVAQALASVSAFEMLNGDCVIEVKLRGADHGTAIDAFMDESPFAGRVPIYLGNDPDGQASRAVCRAKGHAIYVGQRIQGNLSLRGPGQVRDWLAALAVEAEAW